MEARVAFRSALRDAGAMPSTAASRERRVMLAGALVVAFAVVIVYGAIPFARDWQTREARLESQRDRRAYLTTLIARGPQLEQEASNAERALAAAPQRVLHARSTTLGASALQSLLQDAADASHVVVTRLEVSPDTAAVNGESSAGAGAHHVPATMSVYGDINGVTALLGVLAHGPRVISVERLTMQRNSALAGAADVVQATLQLSAPVVTP